MKKKNCIVIHFVLAIPLIISSSCDQKPNESNSPSDTSRLLTRPYAPYAQSEEGESATLPFDTALIKDIKDISFRRLVLEVNQLFLKYEQINESPWNESLESSSEFGLTKEDISEIVKNANVGTTPFSNGTDSIQPYSLISFYQERKIPRKLDELVKHSYFKNFEYNLEEIVPLGFDFIKSNDNKLFGVFFDSKSGGSEAIKIPFMYFVVDSLTVLTPIDSIDTPRGKKGIFENFREYDRIIALPTKEGTKYLLFGGSRRCNACFETFVHLMNFKNDRFEMDFDFYTYLRDYPLIEYDEVKNQITAEYGTDDFMSQCSCLSEKEFYEKYKGKSSEVEDKACKCVFIFNGRTFEPTAD